MSLNMKDQYISICRQNDLIPNFGICAEFAGKQVALFYLPNESHTIYAIGNWDPIGKANVLSRGIVSDINDQLVVSSPLYKQHFDLITGECIEHSDVKVPVYVVELVDDYVLINQ